MQNILSQFKPSDIRKDPYPHILLEEAFSPEIYKNLSISYPEKEISQINSNVKGSNQRIQISTKDIESKSSLLNNVWSNCCKNHTSEEFYEDFLRLFSSFFVKYYGKENSEFLMNYNSLGKRGEIENEINLDFQPGINTPQRRFF